MLRLIEALGYLVTDIHFHPQGVGKHVYTHEGVNHQALPRRLWDAKLHRDEELPEDTVVFLSETKAGLILPRREDSGDRD